MWIGIIIGFVVGVNFGFMLFSILSVSKNK